LFQEFRKHYRLHRGMKAPVEDAVLDALYDWDMLEIVDDGREVSFGLPPETAKENQ
jgi:hypothetical protein